MYLKSLSLYGFKTFAKKTLLEFKPGITAVVGPNGSGKSNLIDAIVWAIGEQSMKSIRGRKMEEVVFHGSETKKPLGFAEIVLTFDNEDNFFPLPHGEISVTRRYFRSGESEFEINRESCRLRDIQSLMLDTGLSATNYSIVSQGDVEYVIDLLPQQRREIFDEAAGINRYKIEKLKTLQKIKETDANISRLRDILTEIEETLEPLREQAERAKRYEQIVEEIGILKLGVFAGEIRRLKAKLEAQNEEEAEVNGRRKEMSGLLEQLRGKQGMISDGIESARRAVDEVLQELASIGGRVGSGGETVRLLARTIEDFERQMQSAEREKADVRKRVADIQDEIKQLSERADSKKKRLSEAQVEWDRMAGESTEDLKKQEQELTAVRDGLLSRLKEINEKETESSREISIARDRLRNIDSQVSERKKNAEKLAALTGKLEAEIKSEGKELESFEKELASKEKSSAGLENEIEEIGSEVESSRAAFERAAANVSSISARIGALEKMAGAMLPSAGAGSPLSDLIAVERGFEPAVRRALNEVLNARPAAKGEIKKLLKGAAGAASIHVVADWLTGAPAPDLSGALKRKGASGKLSDKVKIKSAGDSALAALFARFVVVESPDMLDGIIGELPPGAGAVTADGSACFIDGVLYIGEALPTGVAIKARIDSLKKELVGAEKEAGGIRAGLAVLEKSLAEKNKTFVAVSSEQQKLREKIAAASREAQSGGERLDFYNRERASAAETLKQLNETKFGLESGIGKNEKTLEKTKKDKNQVASELDEKQAALEKVSGLRRNKELIRSDLRVEIGELRRDVEAGDESAAYRRSEVERLKIRETDAGKNVALIGERLKRERADSEKAARELNDWRSKQEAATKQLAERRAALAKSNESLSDLLELMNKKESELSRMKDLLLDLEMKRVRTETQLDETRTNFSEEFPELTEEEAMAKVPSGEATQKSRYLALRKELENIMPINQLAIGEYEEKRNRHDLVSEQAKDLEDTKATLVSAVEEYDRKSRAQFLETFEKVRARFRETFIEMFRGGDADLILTGGCDALEAGVDMAVQVPGKRMRSITLLSGGEKALCALVLIFSLLKVRPSPFYILDEVDAGLDDANIVRFREMLKKYSSDSQFIVVTHNKGTLAGADHFFGITLSPEDGFSKVLTVSID
jgi:chromosome segregation protein